MQGWIDVTFLSSDGTCRLSRGNKGTLFVLAKEATPKDALLQAIRSQAAQPAVEAAITAVCESGDGIRQPARSSAVLGRWKLIWSAQGQGANALQRLLADSVRNWQLLDASGSLENLVELAPWLRVRALGSCKPESATRTRVDINSVVLSVGPKQFELPVKTDGRQVCACWGEGGGEKGVGHMAWSLLINCKKNILWLVIRRQRCEGSRLGRSASTVQPAWCYCPSAGGMWTGYFWMTPCASRGETRAAFSCTCETMRHEPAGSRHGGMTP
jgi:hypothetical protein